METLELIKNLNNIIQTDIDAWHAYDKVVKHTEHADIRKNLLSFQGDHKMHVDELSEQVSKNGGKPPSFTRDFTGFVISGMTAASIVSTKTMLHAMQINEKLTNKTYEEAIQWKGVPEEIAKLLHKCREDEDRHLKYIEQTLNTQSWKSEV